MSISILVARAFTTKENLHINIICVCLKLIIDTEYLSIRNWNFGIQENSSRSEISSFFDTNIPMGANTRRLNLIIALLQHIKKQDFVKIE